MSKRRGRKSRRGLLFYARPERHAERNLFEIGIIALRRCIERGGFKGEWRFLGVGALGREYEIALGGGRELKIISRIPQSEYERVVAEFDVGLSLMWAAHPSVLPFEFARAGVVTVVNAYPGRDRATLSKFGYNIVPADPRT